MAMSLFLYSGSFVTSDITIGLFPSTAFHATPSPLVNGFLFIYASLILCVALMARFCFFSSRSINEQILEFMTSAVTVTISFNISSRYKSLEMALLILEMASIVSQDLDVFFFGFVAIVICRGGFKTLPYVHSYCYD